MSGFNTSVLSYCNHKKQNRIMIHKWAIPVILLTMVTLVSGGCASVQRRIQDNPDFFYSLPLAHQELIRHGEIKVGFHMQEVYLAWGSPTHQTLTESSQGVMETWIYTRLWTETRYRKVRIRDRDSDDWHYSSEPYYVQREKIEKSVSFMNNRVNSWTIYQSPPPYDIYGY